MSAPSKIKWMSWEYRVRIMPKPRTHAKRVLLTHNDSHAHKTCFTHAKWFTHAQCGLQIQNIIHKLMHFASETNTVCFTQSTKKYPSSRPTQNNSTSTEHESCAWIGMHLRTDQQGGKLVPKVTWQTNVLWFTLQNNRWRCSCQTARIPYGFRAV